MYFRATVQDLSLSLFHCRPSSTGNVSLNFGHQTFMLSRTLVIVTIELSSGILLKLIILYIFSSLESKLFAYRVDLLTSPTDSVFCCFHSRNYEFSFDEDAVRSGKKPYKMKVRFAFLWNIYKTHALLGKHPFFIWKQSLKKCFYIYVCKKILSWEISAKPRLLKELRNTHMFITLMLLDGSISMCPSLDYRKTALWSSMFCWPHMSLSPLTPLRCNQSTLLFWLLMRLIDWRTINQR